MLHAFNLTVHLKLCLGRGVRCKVLGLFCLSLLNLTQPWNLLNASLGSTVKFTASISLHTRPLRACVEPQEGVSPPRRRPLVCATLFVIPGTPSHPGERATRPWKGNFRRSPLAEFGGGARSFTGNNEACYVGRAWHRHAAAGGGVAVGRAGVPQGMLTPSSKRRHNDD